MSQSFGVPYSVDVEPDVAYWGPPGTGKTTALMDDLEDELEGGIRPSNVGGFTYRKAMANEFVERAEGAVGTVPDRHWFRTTHSGCFRLLDVHPDDVVDDDAFRDFCSIHGYTHNAPSHESDVDDDSPWATTLTGNKEAEGTVLLKVRSYCLNTGAEMHEWRSAPITAEERELLTDKFVADFNAEYEAWKESEGMVDYDDMLLRVVEENRSPPISVLMEDEFQDKTPLQVAVYNVWANAADRVYVAGDPHQAIYTHQGTDPSFMQDAFDGADEANVLRTSWRLGPDIADVARRTLRRYYEVPHLEPTGTASAERVSWDRYPRLVDQHETDDVMHLARANYHLDRVAGVLSESGVPFTSDMKRWTDRQLDLYNGVAKMVRAIEESPALTQPEFDLRPTERLAVAKALPATALQGKKSAVEEAVDAGATMVQIAKIGDLGTVLSGNPFDGIEKRSSTTLVASQVGSKGIRERMRRAFDSRGAAPIDDVTHRMLTIHGSKGQEADIVFLLDASTWTIWKHAEPEDEARIFYVGATRPIEKLYIVRCPWANYTTDVLPAEI